jgi:hypothetical protein
VHWDALSSAVKERLLKDAGIEPARRLARRDYLAR